MSQIVFVDANVWFSRTLRDWLGMLYTTPDTAPFEIKWTEDVLAEVLYNLRRVHPDWDGGRITRVRDLIARTFEVGRVTDFTVGNHYKGGDALDASVHAAALACGADILLTMNVTDFRWDENESPYEVHAPDGFLMLVDDSAPELVAEVAVAMCHYWFRRKGRGEPAEEVEGCRLPRIR